MTDLMREIFSRLDQKSGRQVVDVLTELKLDDPLADKALVDLLVVAKRLGYYEAAVKNLLELWQGRSSDKVFCLLVREGYVGRHIADVIGVETLTV